MEYDGTNYAGFQRQPMLPSIQARVEEAVAAATGSKPLVTGAGRTDAGAHARHQVISFVTSTRLDDATLLRAMNAHLDGDIAVQQLETVDADFNPRRDATAREYHYLVLNRGVPSPLWRGRAHYEPRKLDISAMRQAAQCLVGVHDFGSFGTPPRAGGSTIREIFRIDVLGDGDIVRFEITGSGFMQRMVRTIVGTLLLVGLGKTTGHDVKSVLNSCDRSKAAAPVPACGLYLMNVTYGRQAKQRGYDA